MGSMERMGVSRGDILQQIVLIHIECIQMVVGYLDIFVFEEFVFALRPVVDSYNSVLEASVIYGAKDGKYGEDGSEQVEVGR